MTVSAANVGFVGQGANIPVRQLSANAGAVLDPRKFGTIVALTREMISSSNAEQLTRAVLIDSVTAALDAALFSSVAGDAGRPPGLFTGATATAAATGTASAA